jgi:hypothetical protein
MKEYLSLRAAAHDVLDAVSEHDLRKLRELLDAVSRTVRRSFIRRGATPLEGSVTQHPLVLLVQARIADISGAPMSWPVSYSQVRETVLKIAHPSWKAPRPAQVLQLVGKKPRATMSEYLRLVRDDGDDQSGPDSVPTDDDYA